MKQITSSSIDTQFNCYNHITVYVMLCIVPPGIDVYLSMPPYALTLYLEMFYYPVLGFMRRDSVMSFLSSAGKRAI